MNSTTAPAATTEKKVKPSRRQQVIQVGNYTPVPNWFFDYFLRGLPPACCAVFLLIYRNTVGYAHNHGSFRTSFDALDDGKHGLRVDKEALARWLWTLHFARFISYEPAKNGVNKTQITIFPDGLPSEEHASRFVQAVKEALRVEKAGRAKGNFNHLPKGVDAETAWENDTPYARRSNAAPQKFGTAVAKLMGARLQVVRNQQDEKLTERESRLVVSGIPAGYRSEKPSSAFGKAE